MLGKKGFLGKLTANFPVYQSIESHDGRLMDNGIENHDLRWNMLIPNEAKSQRKFTQSVKNGNENSVFRALIAQQKAFK